MGCNETKLIFLGCLKFSQTDPPYVYKLGVPPWDNFQFQIYFTSLHLVLVGRFDVSLSKNEIKRLWDTFITDHKGCLEFMQFVRHFTYSAGNFKSNILLSFIYTVPIACGITSQYYLLNSIVNVNTDLYSDPYINLYTPSI